jgi:Crp-like helix-turn-helix domain
LWVPRFTDALLNLSAQTSACNRLHSIEQRCARWLLIASDRIRSDTMPMTHEFLSSMLGVRRAGVSATAAELQRSGLIRYHHGQVTIIDHDGLVGPLASATSSTTTVWIGCSEERPDQAILAENCNRTVR